MGKKKDTTTELAQLALSQGGSVIAHPTGNLTISLQAPTGEPISIVEGILARMRENLRGSYYAALALEDSIERIRPMLSPEIMAAIEADHRAECAQMSKPMPRPRLGMETNPFDFSWGAYLYDDIYTSIVALCGALGCHSGQKDWMLTGYCHYCARRIPAVAIGTKVEHI